MEGRAVRPWGVAAQWSWPYGGSICLGELGRRTGVHRLLRKVDSEQKQESVKVVWTYRLVRERMALPQEGLHGQEFKGEECWLMGNSQTGLGIYVLNQRSH